MLNSELAGAGGDSRGGSGGEDSRAKGCEDMGQDSARLRTHVQDRLASAPAGRTAGSLFGFLVISLPFFFFFRFRKLYLSA